MKDLIFACFFLAGLLFFAGCTGERSTSMETLYVCFDGSIKSQSSLCPIQNFSCDNCDCDCGTVKESKAVVVVEKNQSAANCSSGYGFVGNKLTKVYHHPNCSYAKKMSAENRVCFSDMAEAEAAGYKACKICFSAP